MTIHNAPTLPHERELLDLIQLVFEAYQADDPNYLCLCITDTHEHGRYLIGKLRDATQWDHPNTKIFRDGVSVKGGGKVIVVSADDPGRLMGIRPTKIVLFGRLGELFYWLNSMGVPINGSA